MKRDAKSEGWAPTPGGNCLSQCHSGQSHYLLFCANCHGADADGRGPLVGLLKVTPSNLTVLRHLGPPSVAERVLVAVDGGHQVAAGEHKMPVFSENLEVRTVREIATYLTPSSNSAGALPCATSG
ncbi:MAG TPA: cytochrome c [Chromatiaceae bacterium]|nr:cytochrome c [Chromatiaceae bacterium]